MNREDLRLGVERFIEFDEWYILVVALDFGVPVGFSFMEDVLGSI